MSAAASQRNNKKAAQGPYHARLARPDMGGSSVPWVPLNDAYVAANLAGSPTRAGIRCAAIPLSKNSARKSSREPCAKIEFTKDCKDNADRKQVGRPAVAGPSAPNRASNCSASAAADASQEIPSVTSSVFPTFRVTPGQILRST